MKKWIGGKRAFQKKEHKDRLEKFLDAKVREVEGKVDAEMSKWSEVTNVNLFKKTIGLRTVPLYAELAIFLEMSDHHMSHSLLKGYSTENTGRGIQTQLKEFNGWCTLDKTQEIATINNTSYFNTTFTDGRAVMFLYLLERGTKDVRAFLINSARRILLIYAFSDWMMDDIYSRYNKDGHVEMLYSIIKTLTAWFKKFKHMSPDITHTFPNVDSTLDWNLVEYWDLQANTKDAHLKECPRPRVLLTTIDERRVWWYSYYDAAKTIITQKLVASYEDTILNLNMEASNLSSKYKERDREVARLTALLQKTTETKTKVEYRDTPSTLAKLEKYRAKAESAQQEAFEARSEIKRLSTLLKDGESNKKTSEEESKAEVIREVPDDKMQQSLLSLLRDKRILVVGDESVKNKFTAKGFTAVSYFLVTESAAPAFDYTKFDIVLAFTGTVKHRHMWIVNDAVRGIETPIKYIDSKNFGIILKEIFTTLY